MSQVIREAEREARRIREDQAVYEWWQARLKQPDHPVTLIVAELPRLTNALELIVRSAFTSGIHFAEEEVATH